MKLPKNKSFQVICANADNPLFIVHLNVFLLVAKVVTPFLTLYQTDSPMLPFIQGDLHDLIRDPLARFIQKSVLDKTDTVIKVLRLEPTDHKQHVASNKVDIGFAVENLQRELHKRA